MDEQDALQLAALLREGDTPCPGCGYNLRGLHGQRCPECNQALVLRVVVAQRHVGQLFAAAAGPLTAAGSAVVGFAAVIIMTIRVGPPGKQQMFTVYGIPPIVAAIGGLAAWALLCQAGRRWFRRRSRSGRIAVIVGGWVLLLAAFVWFFLGTVQGM